MAPAPNVAYTTGLRADSYQQLQDALTARGVTWQRLETIGDTGEWKFNCSVPNRQTPNLNRRNVARRRTDLDAIRAVLEQIDRDQRPAGY
jgi:hypothetical protein